MATNDLMTELQKDSIKLDDDSERKVCLYWFTVRPVKVFELCIDPLITYRLTGREDDSQAPGRQKRRGSEPGCKMVKTLPFFLRLLPVAARLVTLGAFVFNSLGPLVSKVKEYQVETIVDTLCTNMLSDKEQLRDISSIGLKTVIGELPPASSGKNTTSTPAFRVLLPCTAHTDVDKKPRSQL